MKLEDSKEFIERKHPGSKVQWTDKGQMNFIAIVDERFVYKFPKSPDHFRLLAKEHAIYELLESHISLKIPRSIELNAELGHLRLSFIAGVTLTANEASSLLNSQKSDLAKKLAVFIIEMNLPELKAGFEQIFKNDINDFYYVENWLKKIAEYCEGKTDVYCEKYALLYKKLSAALPYGFCVGDIVAHKDLHEDNMLFNENNDLCGIIDFAELRYTSIYSELRTIARFGLDVVEEILCRIGPLAHDALAKDVMLFACVYEMAIVVQDKYLKKELPWRVQQAEFYLGLWGEL